MKNKLFFNKLFFYVCLVSILFLSAPAIFSQKPPLIAKPSSILDSVRDSSAFAEILLRSTELESELESLLLDYTDEFPKVKEMKFTLSVLNRDRERLLQGNPAETARLSQALGKLIVRRADLETDHWKLLQSYKDEHPDVKRAKRRVEIFDRAIKEILR